MKILQIHNAYLQRGGEDVVVERERDLLRSRGHEVITHLASNEDIRGIAGKIKTALEVAYSKPEKKRLAARLRAEKPDVVHVHNFFPLLSPSVFDACQEENVPSVMTLHNFRLMCVNGLLFRDGHVCDECVSGSPYKGSLHGCYRDSWLASLPVSHMVSRHRRQGTWSNKVGRFITMTHFGKSQFAVAGIPPDLITVKAHFLPDMPFETPRPPTPARALFVGRLSMEKGISTLLDAWKNLSVTLDVIGDGPLRELCEKKKSPSVRLLGRQDSSFLLTEMSRSSFLVMPSVYYETFGLVLIEAFSRGLPPIVSRLGSMAEIVEDGVTGLHFEPGNAVDLAQKVKWASEHPAEMAEMGWRARNTFLEKYSAEVNYRELMKIYGGLVR